MIAVPAIAALAETMPVLGAELDISSDTVDLADGDADVGWRATLAVDERPIVARKIAEPRWEFHSSTD